MILRNIAISSLLIGLKIRRDNTRGGSTPPSGTKLVLYIILSKSHIEISKLQMP